MAQRFHHRVERFPRGHRKQTRAHIRNRQRLTNEGAPPSENKRPLEMRNELGKRRNALRLPPSVSSSAVSSSVFVATLLSYRRRSSFLWRLLRRRGIAAAVSTPATPGKAARPTSVAAAYGNIVKSKNDERLLRSWERKIDLLTAACLRNA